LLCLPPARNFLGKPGWLICISMGVQPDTLDLDIISDLARSELFVFAKYILGYDRMDARVHQPLCRALTDRVLKDAGDVVGDVEPDWPGVDTERNAPDPRVTRIGCRKFKLLELPRGSYKTTISSVALPLWLIWRNPQWSIMVASAGEELAQRIMREIERQITSNPVFKRTCGDWYAGNRQWTTLSKTFAFKKNVTEASIFATSVTSSKTGLHPNAAILDDVFDERAANSTPIAEQVRRFFDDLPFLLVDPGYRWVLGTPWAMFDIYYYIESDSGMRELYDNYIRSCWNPDGTLWSPKTITEDRIRAAKLELRHRPWHFNLQYRMMRTPKSEQTLMSNKIHTFANGEAPDRAEMNVAVGIDPAGMRGTGTSEWALAVVGVTGERQQEAGPPAPDFYALDIVKQKMSASEAVEKVIGLVDKWSADWIVVESVGISHQFLDATLKPELRRRGINIRIIEVKPHGEAKHARIRDVENGFGPVVADGRFWMRDDHFELQQELQQFPSDASFDILDILAYIVRDTNANRRWPREYRKAKGEAKQHGSYDEYLADKQEEKQIKQIMDAQRREKRALKRRRQWARW